MRHHDAVRKEVQWMVKEELCKDQLTPMPKLRCTCTDPGRGHIHRCVAVSGPPPPATPDHDAVHAVSMSLTCGREQCGIHGAGLRSYQTHASSSLPQCKLHRISGTILSVICRRRWQKGCKKWNVVLAGTGGVQTITQFQWTRSLSIYKMHRRMGVRDQRLTETSPRIFSFATSIADLVPGHKVIEASSTPSDTHQ